MKLAACVGARLATLLLCCAAACAPIGAASRNQDSACAATQNFPNPMLLEAMQRGVNLPGWDAPDRRARPTRVQLEALRFRGFTHVRLPLDEARLSSRERESYLDAMVDEIVRLLSLDYAISLDLHAGATIGAMFERDPGEAEAYLTETWLAIARRVRGFDPTKVAVELLNEPEMSQSAWHETAAGLIAKLRALLPSTTFVVGPAGPQRHEALADMPPFDDRGVIYAIHYYDPFIFTHQGMDWGPLHDPIRDLKDLPFPAAASDAAVLQALAILDQAGHRDAALLLRRSLQTPWTEDQIASAFKTIRDWGDRTTRPVIVNEFGVLSYHAPREARLRWLAAVRRQAEAHCLGWTHWDFGNGFGLIDPSSGMPDEGVMEALTGE